MKKVSLLLIIFIFCTSILPITDISAQSLELSAPSAILMEASSGEILFDKNSSEIRTAASITKVMTLILTMEALENGSLSLDDTLYASAHAASMGGSDIWLEEGEGMTVDELIKATVIMSANDAAVVLAENIGGSEEAFVEMMNSKALELDMADTVFKNPNGLEEEGHVTTAYDIALMSRELIKHEKIFDYTLVWIDHLRNGETQLVNTNKLINTYSGITGLKTGTTSQAGSCITATAKRENLELIAVVLGCSSSDERFKDSATLLDYGFAKWKMIDPGIPAIDPVPISGGMKDFVSATTEGSSSILADIGAENNVTSEILIYEDITAPILVGDELGKVLIKNGEETVKEFPILSGENVDEISFSGAFMYFMGRFANSFG